MNSERGFGFPPKLIALKYSKVGCINDDAFGCKQKK